MSVKVMAEVWEHSKAAGTALLVELALADHADEETRSCWPSLALLARKTRTSEDTVRRQLKKLKSLKEIEMISGGGHRSSRYTIRRYTPSNLQPQTPQLATPSNLLPLADSDPRGSTRAHPEVARVQGEPSITVIEPSTNGAPASPLAPFESEFSKLWEILPKRKGDSRKEALRCYQARRREGITAGNLLTAASNYRDNPERKNKPEYTLSAKTFLGPNEKWRSSLETDSTTPAAVIACPECLVSGTHTPDCSQRSSSNVR